MSYGALGSQLALEFGERNSAILVFVHFLNNLGRFFLRDVETARLNKSLEFFSVDAAIIVHIERVEGVVHVEVWHALEALADALSSGLRSEVSSPDGLEIGGSGGHEAVIASVDRVTMVGETTLNHTGVVSIKSEECVRELAHIEATVTSGIVPGDEEIELLASWEHADSSETFSELNSTETSTVIGVEDLESICQVEVTLLSKSNLLSFDVVLTADKITKTVNKFIFISKVEDGLARWASVASWLGRSSHWAR